MGRRKHGNGSGTPSCKRKHSALLRQNVPSPDNIVEEAKASDVPNIDEAREENKATENPLSPKAVERDREAIPPHEYEESKSENPEKVGSSAVEENLQAQEELVINQVFNQAPVSTLTGESEINPNIFACTFPDTLLTGGVEETRINPHNVEDDGAEDPRTPRKSTSQEFVPNTQFFHPDSPSFVTICNDEHIKPQILEDLNTDANITLVPEKSSSINDTEIISGEAEVNNSQENNSEAQATVDVQGRHSACCNLAALLTSQNDALQNEVHGLKNELASLSYQMFDLEARCGKLDTTNQQLLCRIREYEDLGSREEIVRCGEQIGQFTEFLQAMLQDATQTMNNTFGAGPCFFHPLH
ncbi:uncharacterized protein LOC131071610 isoform X2 [Cryptomeria japonica]|uniref:uncharacterized protein LOC131071610 isoform X2 n=1 Tax=Cryptomeria japonica TaxID=3369 RepID=UPI0025ABD4C8|nr:uncharacterized protein LOC131071610 isoform X2 [Cryptomeria japonica]